MRQIPVQRKTPAMEFNLIQREDESDEDFEQRVTNLEKQCLRTPYAYHIEYKGEHREGVAGRTVDFVTVP